VGANPSRNDNRQEGFISTKLPPDLQKICDEEADRYGRGHNGSPSDDTRAFVAGAQCIYTLLQAQASATFDESEFGKWFLKCSTHTVQPNALQGARWQHARDFAAMQGKDSEISKLKAKLLNANALIDRADELIMSGHSDGGLQQKHWIEILKELKGQKP